MGAQATRNKEEIEGGNRGEGVSWHDALVEFGPCGVRFWELCGHRIEGFGNDVEI